VTAAAACIQSPHGDARYTSGGGGAGGGGIPSYTNLGGRQGSGGNIICCTSLGCLACAGRGVGATLTPKRSDGAIATHGAQPWAND
jgi:hypothetical protein